MADMNEITSIADIQRLVLEGFTDWRQHGNVKVRQRDDLLIFNYNPLAQFEGRWNFFERVSRGLVIDSNTGEVVARGFDKFYGWLEGGRYTESAIVAVTEKLDGSIGMLYRTPNGYRVTTRGSLTSNQGEWASRFLQANYDLGDLPDELTLIFEIIYPANRVVVNYEEREDLVLLAARNRFSGDYLPFDPVVTELAQQYGFSLPSRYEFQDVRAVMVGLEPLDGNHEGYVVEFADGSRFKFKGQRYLELHKLIHALSFKNTLAVMETGSVQAILETVPDEFLGEVRQWIQEIETTIARIKTEAQAVFEIAPKETRKDFALWVRANHLEMSAYLFAMMDSKPLEPIIYKYHEWEHTEEAELEDT